MKALIEYLGEKIGAKRAATWLAVLQVIVAAAFAYYQDRASAQLTATQVQALVSVRRAIDQAAEIAAQDAALSAPIGQSPHTNPPQGDTK